MVVTRPRPDAGDSDGENSDDVLQVLEQKLMEADEAVKVAETDLKEKKAIAAALRREVKKEKAKPEKEAKL